jgi:ABC-type uncharacterized transport system substrate-binding protein
MALPLRKIVNVLISVFLVGVASLFIYESISRPRILIVHSYNSADPWVKDVNIGLMRVLEKKGSYSLRWQYMGLNNYPDAQSRRTATNTVKQTIEEWKPNILIAIDDEAQDLVARDYVNHPSIKVVFAGVESDIIGYRYLGAQNVTGVIELKPLMAYRNALIEIAKLNNYGAAPLLFSIADKSASANFDHTQIKSFDWKPMRLVDSVQVGTYDEWQEKILQVGKQVDFIMISSYRELARSATDPKLVPPEEVVSWTEANTKVPVIGTSALNVEDGGSLAIGVSPFEQGQLAARMALVIIDSNKNYDGVPVVTGQQFIVATRMEELKKKHIRIPAMYEAFARAIGKNL